ncbi:MAG: hypothetical protein AAFW75_33355, partial [Cyanobacteria bacterium J06636_16]
MKEVSTGNFELVTQPSDHQEAITIKNFWRLLDTELISIGLPGILIGIGVTHAREDEWSEAIKFFILASILWLL